MNDEDLELANRLFAAATAMLEDAIEVAAAGQSHGATPSRLADHGRRLRAAARDIAVLAEAAMIAANRGADRPSNPRDQRR